MSDPLHLHGLFTRRMTSPRMAIEKMPIPAGPQSGRARAWNHSHASEPRRCSTRPWHPTGPPGGQSLPGGTARDGAFPGGDRHQQWERGAAGRYDPQLSDALTAIPLWLAFNLSRRKRNTRYTYGYGRAEDLAGAVIVTLIFLSALEVFYQSIQKIIHPLPVSNLGWVAVAAVIGFLGNELAAILRLRTGRVIHSAALVADGRHSQVDGFTSLGVLAGVIGVKLGFPLADPLVGFFIGTAILVVAWNSAREIWYRLMDATDPQVTRLVEQTAAALPGVLGVEDIRLLWLGHWQHCELHITVDAQFPTAQSHQVAETVRHALFHALPTLQESHRARRPVRGAARLGACFDRPSYRVGVS